MDRRAYPVSIQPIPPLRCSFPTGSSRGGKRIGACVARGRSDPPMPARPIALSVLDLSPVAAGSSGAVSLRNSLDLARFADQLGYTRYWLAEHHNLPSIASSAPDIMIGQVAASTERIRVGSGGVMLPNHAPLMVAERFKVLEALFPGRIDLGLGRAPGTDPVTSYALRRRQDAGDDDFLERLQELLLFESNAFPEGHPFRSVRAMPQDVALPPILALGIERIQRPARRCAGCRLFLRAPFRRSRSSRRDAQLPRSIQAVRGPARAVRHSGLRRGLRRQRGGSATPRLDHRSQFRATQLRAIFAVGEPGGSRGLSLFAGGARIDRAQSPAPVRRHEGDGAGATFADDRCHQSR